MARATRLKVYRTPIGFHDAYVAAASQKAALAAWGSVHDLFATGEAELVTDPVLAESALARPGEIVRRVRGTPAQHIAALPPEPDPPPPRAAAKPKPEPKPKPRAPRPDDDAVGAAKQAFADALARHDRERAGIVRREEELRQEKRALIAAQKAETARLRDAVAAVAADHKRALATWRTGGG